MKGNIFKIDSSDKTAVIGSVGAVLGVIGGHYVPNLPYVGQYSDILYGAILSGAGLYVDHDGLGAFLLSVGLGFVLYGIIEVFVPTIKI